MENQMIIPLFVLGAYLCGSISSAVLVCKLMLLPDPRTAGSNNPGTTNVLRLGGKKAALLTLVGDALKGFVPVLLAKVWIVDPVWIAVCLLMAFLGHLYPIFFRFQGGTGVATAIGGLFALNCLLGIAFVGTWLVVAFLLRYSSLAAMVSAVVVPIAAYAGLAPLYAPPLALMSLLLLWRHRENMQRIWLGTEGKLGVK